MCWGEAPRTLRGGAPAGLTVAAAAVLATGCASGPPPAPPGPLAPPPSPPAAPYVEADHAGLTLEPPDVTVDPGDPILGSVLAEHPEVREEIHYWILRWQTWGEGYFRRYLERMGRYAPLVDSAVAERGLPPSLRFLPIVESGYNPRAASPVGAVGMWQFMRGTARFLGLDVTPLLDERRDPWKATGVALDYLAELHESFGGSWFLALAAYNSGPGRVQRILRRHAPGAVPGDSLYWALRDHFPPETRDFVPKLLAAAEVARRPARYGFDVRVEAPARAVGVEVPDATSVDVLARAAGLETETVRELNGHLRRGYTPPGRATTVRIPEDRVEAFRAAYREIPPGERVSFVEHRIRRGETLSHVSDRYRVPLREILAANPGLRPRRIRIGQWVVVPRAPSVGRAEGVRAFRGGGGGRALRAARPGRVAAEHRVTEAGVVHRVTAGESLWKIARRHGVGVSDLRAWNGLGSRTLLHPGDELRVAGGQAVVYRVRPGDTISEIADRHGVRTRDLLRVNGLRRGSVIRPGDEVRIPGAESSGG